MTPKTKTIDGRLMRKMIACNLPYEVQLQAIHMDDVEPGFISRMCDELRRVDKAHKQLTVSRSTMAYFNAKQKEKKAERSEAVPEAP